MVGTILQNKGRQSTGKPSTPSTGRRGVGGKNRAIRSCRSIQVLMQLRRGRAGGWVDWVDRRTPLAWLLLRNARPDPARRGYHPRLFSAHGTRSASISTRHVLHLPSCSTFSALSQPQTSASDQDRSGTARDMPKAFTNSIFDPVVQLGSGMTAYHSTTVRQRAVVQESRCSKDSARHSAQSLA